MCMHVYMHMRVGAHILNVIQITLQKSFVAIEANSNVHMYMFELASIATKDFRLEILTKP